MSVDMSSAFGQMWQFLSQRFLLFFQWTDQITIGGVSLLKIGIGLTVLTIVIAVVLPIIRTSPVNSGINSSRGELAIGSARDDPKRWGD